MYLYLLLSTVPVYIHRICSLGLILLLTLLLIVSPVSIPSVSLPIVCFTLKPFLIQVRNQSLREREKNNPSCLTLASFLLCARTYCFEIILPFYFNSINSPQKSVGTISSLHIIWSLNRRQASVRIMIIACDTDASKTFVFSLLFSSTFI